MPGLDKVLWLPRGIHSIWQGRQMGASIKAMCSRVCAGTKAGTEVGWEVVNVNVFHFACVRVREVSRYCWYFSLFDIHQHKMYCFSVYYCTSNHPKTEMALSNHWFLAHQDGQMVLAGWLDWGWRILCTVTPMSRVSAAVSGTAELARHLFVSPVVSPARKLILAHSGVGLQEDEGWSCQVS